MLKILIRCLILFIAGCGRGSAPPPPTVDAKPTVASTVPSATDLIVGMGGADRLVAVSTYDQGRADVGSLPKAGDYQTVDWELLARLKPAVLCTAISPDRQSTGFKQHAADLGIAPLDARVDHLGDLDSILDQLGTALKMPEQARQARQSLHQRLDAIKQRVAALPRWSTLIVIGPDADSIAGPGTYLDELLTIAGGVNAAQGLQTPWPKIDHEMLLSLHPQVILQLISGPVQEQQRARQTWQQFASVPAVASHRVYILNGPYLMLPGWHVPETAAQFADCLHPALPEK